MADIERFEGINVGGCKRLILYETNALQEQRGAITFVGERNTMYVQPDSLVYSQNLRLGSEGLFYETEVSFTIPVETPEISDFLAQRAGAEFLAVVTDNNLESWVLGDQNNRLKLSFRAETGAKAANLNAVRARLFGQGLVPKRNLLPTDFVFLPVAIIVIDGEGIIVKEI